MNSTDATSRVSSGVIQQRHVPARRLWCMRFLLAMISPILFFGLIELVLSVFQFGYPSSFFIPGNDPGTLTTNEWFTWFYHRTPPGSPHPCIVNTEKPAETVRIFVLGESAGMGTPDPAFGFARMLEYMLQRQIPNRQIEVINTAVRGINSHIIADISKECSGLQPDLFVVYMGNNEVCGLYGPETFLCRHPQLIPVLHHIRQTRISQWLSLLIQGHPSSQTAKDKTQTMEYFREHRMALDDPRREAVWRNYERNLRTILANARKAGAGVIVSTAASNLKDCPPLGSLHRADLSAEELSQWEQLVQKGDSKEQLWNFDAAIEAYRSAIDIDSKYAELHFRLGRTMAKAGNPKEAYEHFVLARDWDALAFRADSQINEVIRKIAAEYANQQVRLLDMEKEIVRSDLCEDGIPGDQIFSDHVHFHFNGDYELARFLLRATVKSLALDRGIVPSDTTITSRDDCAKRLAFTAWDRVNTAAAVANMTALPPFTDQLDHSERQVKIQTAIDKKMKQVNESFIASVIDEYRQSIAAHPNDWMLRYNLATLLYQLQRYPEAAEWMTPVAEAFPSVYRFRVCLGYALGQSGRKDLAATQFRLALRQDSRFKPAKEALQWALQPSQVVEQTAD